MTSRQWSTPLPLQRRTQSAEPALDLQAQIEAVEQRLIAREAWLKATTESLTQRAQVALTPKPWVLPAAGAGLVLWLGWRWWHRKKSMSYAPADVYANGHAIIPAPAPKQAFERIADLPWAGLTALGWPLAPAAWRERLSPADAVNVVSAVLSLGRRLFQRGDH